MKKFKALEDHACRFNDGDHVCDCFVEGYKAKERGILKEIKEWNESGYQRDCLGVGLWKELLKIIKNDT